MKIRPFHTVAMSAALGVALALAVALTSLPAGASVPSDNEATDATPIVGGASFAAAVLITPTVEYAGVVSSTHTNDYFYLDVPTGRIATVVFTSTSPWGNGVTFRLWDQGHVSALKSLFINGIDQTNQWTYVGNSTTPTRYFFQAQVNGSPQNHYLFKIWLTNQTDGNAPGDAGDTIGTARVITPTQNVATTYYTNTVGNVDLTDYLRINALPGQIISVTMTIVDWGNSSGLGQAIYDQGSTQLANVFVSHPDTLPRTLGWMSNRTAPSVYYLRYLSNSNTGLPTVYRVDVALSRQNDFASGNDGGDVFDFAVPVTLTSQSLYYSSSGNLLGGGDKDDYLFFKLPFANPPITPQIRYRINVQVESWPATFGYLNINFYDAQRSPVSGLNGFLTHPTTAEFSKEVTTCGNAGCYVKFNTTYGGNNPIRYKVTLTPIRFLYMPIQLR